NCSCDERPDRARRGNPTNFLTELKRPQCFVEMATEFKFVAIPEAFARLIGVADDGTRIFRAEGNHAAMRRWFDALCEYIGPCVSPGEAAVYAKVSRAAVYKRMKAGGL